MNTLFNIVKFVIAQAFNLVLVLIKIVAHMPVDDDKNTVNKATEFEYRPVGKDGEMIQVAKSIWD